MKQGEVGAGVDAGERVVVGVQDPVFAAGTRGKMELEFSRILRVRRYDIERSIGS